MKKANKCYKVFIPFFAFLIFLVGSLIFLNTYKVNYQHKLPLTLSINHDDVDLEDIAYKFWFELVMPYKESQTPRWERLEDVRFNKFQPLAGDTNEFAIAVSFWVKPSSEWWSIYHNWGNKDKDGTIHDIQWTMRIKKTSTNEYTLISIEETDKSISGLAPLKNHFQKEAGIDVKSDKNQYMIEGDKLRITYNNGKEWIDVPVNVDELFAGDYNGSNNQLISGSYQIDPERTAFTLIEENNNLSNGIVKVISSIDQGKTWQESVIPSALPFVRLRLLGYLSDQNGYLILTGDRTMRYEAHEVFITSDGGTIWKKVSSVPDVYKFVTDGGFIDHQLGFLSFGSINVMDKPSRPYLFRTEDGGASWSEVKIPIPPEYQEIFIEAQMPVFDGQHGALLVNQGPSGDFQGGKVMARFTSLDGGKSWSFANLVSPE